MSLTARLRATLRPTHDRLEELPLTRAMSDGRLPRPLYQRLLAELSHLHEPFEAELGRRPEWAGLYRPEMARAGLLRRDRAALGPDPEQTGPMPATRQLAEHVRLWGRDRPWALLGVLYVLEGSRMGSALMAGKLAGCLGVPCEPGRGLDYHLDGGAERPKRWQRFKADLDDAPLSPAQQDDVVAAASEAMDRIHELYAQLSAVLGPLSVVLPATDQGQRTKDN